MFIHDKISSKCSKIIISMSSRAAYYAIMQCIMIRVIFRLSTITSTSCIRPISLPSFSSSIFPVCYIISSDPQNPSPPPLKNRHDAQFPPPWWLQLQSCCDCQSQEDWQKHTQAYDGPGAKTLVRMRMNVMTRMMPMRMGMNYGHNQKWSPWWIACANSAKWHCSAGFYPSNEVSSPGTGSTWGKSASADRRSTCTASFFQQCVTKRPEFLPLFWEPDLCRTDFGQLFYNVKYIMIVPKELRKTNHF